MSSNPRFPVNTPALYVPDHSSLYRDVVIVKSLPAEDGTVDAISARHHGKTIRVMEPLLQPLPAFPDAPAGDVTDWWSVIDKSGQEIARVQADTDPQARRRALGDGAVRAVNRRENGFAVRRLFTSETVTPIGQLTGPPRTPR